MVAKARRLLRAPAAPAPSALAPAEVEGGGGEGGSDCGRGRGLLLVVETFSVDRRAPSWPEQTYLHQWVSAIEALGFAFLRHQYLQSSHALCFVTRAVADLEAELAEEVLPELPMRREAREAGWDAFRPQDHHAKSRLATALLPTHLTSHVTLVGDEHRGTPSTDTCATFGRTPTVLYEHPQ